MRAHQSVLIILEIAIPGLGDGILLRVLRHLGLQTLCEIDAVYLSKAENKIECVAEFIDDIPLRQDNIISAI